MQSKAATVDQYIAELPDDRRAAISAIRAVILKNLDTRGPDGQGGFKEGMQYGMIGYYVPHSIYPPGYHCDPRQGLPFAGLASQKNYISVYLMNGQSPGEESWLRQEFAKAGKKLDMGKCCIRAKRLEDLAIDVIGEAVRRINVKSYIEFYERALLSMGKTPSRKPAKPAAQPATQSQKATTGAPARTATTKTNAGKTSKAATTASKRRASTTQKSKPSTRVTKKQGTKKRAAARTSRRASR